MKKRETDEREFLINGYCDLVNKLFYFIQNYFEGIVPAGRLDEALYWKTKELFDTEGDFLREGRKKELTRLLCGYLQFANEYFDQGRLWENGKNDRRICRNTVLNSVQMVANLAVLLAPIAEYPAGQVSRMLELGSSWEIKSVHSGYELPGAAAVISEGKQIGA